MPKVKLFRSDSCPECNTQFTRIKAVQVELRKFRLLIVCPQCRSRFIAKVQTKQELLPLLVMQPFMWIGLLIMCGLKGTGSSDLVALGGGMAFMVISNYLVIRIFRKRFEEIEKSHKLVKVKD